jgi:3-phytase
VRVSSLTLDPTAFPTATALKTNAQLGRLTVTATKGDTDGDSDFDQLYVLGARSFSVRNASGELIFDSGDQFEQITAQSNPAGFNLDNDNNSRSTPAVTTKDRSPKALRLASFLDGPSPSFVSSESGGSWSTTSPIHSRPDSFSM